MRDRLVKSSTYYLTNSYSLSGSPLQRADRYCTYGSLLVSMVCLIHLMTACTTPAPHSEQRVEEVKAEAVDSQTALQRTKDSSAIKESIFVKLSEDASEVSRWEKSEAWVHFYQGQLTSALEAFETEVSSEDPALREIAQVGQVRTRLESSLAFAHLDEISSYLIPLWLEYERSRPNSGIHKNYYDLIESLAANSASPKQFDDKDILALVGWLTFKTDHAPASHFKVRSSFKKWHRFTKAVHDGDLNTAKSLFNKLNSSALLLISKGDAGVPDLKVYDPRAPRVLSLFYANLVLEDCKTLSFGSYYCGRAHEIKGDLKAALSSYQEAVQQLSTLITEQSNSGSLYSHHVLMSTHLSLASFQDELKARIEHLDPAASIPPSSEHEAESTVKEVWQTFNSQSKKNIPALFPERRRFLGLEISSALDQAKGKDLDYVASLALSDRWLDELHYIYAVELVRRDERVRALKVLNAAEEAKAGARLQGRNRLPRLLLSAYNQIKMGRFRVGAKYFQRLKEKLPSLSLSLMMTSDILSGKSFEQQGSRANAGQ